MIEKAAKITSKLIENTKLPEQGQVIIRDSLLPGLGLRSTSGGSSYIVEARVNGRSKRITVGRADLFSVEEARKRAVQLLAQMTIGIDPDLEKQKKREAAITLQEVLEQYLSIRSLRPRTVRAYRNVLNQRLGDWLRLPITSISRTMIEERHRYISTVGGKWKPSKLQANMAMRILRLLLNYAQARYQRLDGEPIVFSNPVMILTQDKSWNRESPRQRLINDHQLADWYRAVMGLRNTNARDCLLLMIFTGLRFRETATLQWADVDLQDKTLTIRSEIAKNHQEHKLPLSEYILELLKKRKQSNKGVAWIFPGRLGPLSKIEESINIVRKKSRCEFSPHDLRRTYLNIGDRIGVAFHVLKRLANHKGGKDTTAGYLVLNTERLREPVESISRKLLVLMQKEQTLAEALHQYISENSISPRTRTAYQNILKQRVGDWMELPLASISFSMIEQKHEEISTIPSGGFQASKSQAGMVVRILRLLLRWKGLPAPVGTGIPNRARNRKIIPDKKLPGLYAAMLRLNSAAVRTLILCMLLTGIEKRKACSLKWADVDLKNGVASVAGKTIPLCSFLVSLLAEMKRSNEYVFVGRNGELKKLDHSSARLMQEIGMQFTMHDLRRTYFRHARVSGYSAHTLNAMSIDEHKKAAEKIGSRILKLMRYQRHGNTSGGS